MLPTVALGSSQSRGWPGACQAQRNCISPALALSQPNVLLSGQCSAASSCWAVIDQWHEPLVSLVRPASVPVVCICIRLFTLLP